MLRINFLTDRDHDILSECYRPLYSLILTTMKDGTLSQMHPLSFRHRIKDGGSHYIDTEHFMGIDPLDHAKFHEIYKPVQTKDKKENS